MYCSCYFAILISTVICYVGGENTLKFLVIGDWGGKDKSPYYTPAQLNVARQMGKTAEEVGAEFTISVGDNFFSNGVQDVDDPRFKETFEVSRELISVFLYHHTSGHIYDLWSHCAHKVIVKHHSTINLWDMAPVSCTGKTCSKILTKPPVPDVTQLLCTYQCQAPPLPSWVTIYFCRGFDSDCRPNPGDINWCLVSAASIHLVN